MRGSYTLGRGTGIFRRGTGSLWRGTCSLWRGTKTCKGTGLLGRGTYTLRRGTGTVSKGRESYVNVQLKIQKHSKCFFNSKCCTRWPDVERVLQQYDPGHQLRPVPQHLHHQLQLPPRPLAQRTSLKMMK